MYEMPFWRSQLLHSELSDGLPARPMLSVVVPCYNEQVCLEALYERVGAAARHAVGDNYEIVLIDDGSRDRTWEIMRSYGETDSRVLALRLSRNYGHQIALSAGLDLCQGDYILIIDADLQDPPELLRPMMDMMAAQEADVVYALRAQRHGETWFKRATAKIFYRLLSAASGGTPIPVDTGDFRLMTRRALDALRAMPEQSRFIRGMVAWVGFKQVPFHYEREERLAGQSNYPLTRMVRLALDALTSFSSVPLRLAGYAGMLFALLAVGMIVYSVVGWFSGHTIPGWTSLMVVTLVIGSVQMFVLGVMGEYVGRIYNQSKNRPLYIVSDVSGEIRSAPRQGIVARAGHRLSIPA